MASDTKQIQRNLFKLKGKSFDLISARVVNVLKLHRLMTDSRAFKRCNKYFMSMVDNVGKTFFQFYACHNRHQHSHFKLHLTSRDLLRKVIPFQAANQKKNETQFSNPIPNADFFHEFKADFFLVFHFAGFFSKRKKKKIQLLTTQNCEMLKEKKS